MDPSDSQKPECPGGGHEITTMVGESSTRLANVSYLNTSSTINNELAWRDSGRQDFISFNAGSDEKDIIYDAQMQLLHGFPCSPIFFEGADQQTYGFSMELDG